jgi:hypothetical protein
MMDTTNATQATTAMATSEREASLMDWIAGPMLSARARLDSEPNMLYNVQDGGP